MPKQAKSSTAKVREISCQYPNEFGKTPAGNLQYNFFDVSVKCYKKFFLESHRKSKLHQAKLAKTSSFQGKQTYIQLDRTNFKEKVVSSFLAADIPLHKLNHSAIKSLFVATGKLLSFETAARASVVQLASQKKENIRELLLNKKVFLIVNEIEVDKQKYINVLQWVIWIHQMKHFLLSAFHVKAVAMLTAVLLYALLMTYCDNLGPNEKILYCSQHMLLGKRLWMAKH